MSQAEQDGLWDAVVLGAGPGELDRLDRFDRTVELLHPPEPHWYLGVLATDPSRRRAGLARAALRSVLKRADRHGTSVFLETGTPENLPFYERFAFGVLAEAQVPDGPHVWALRRERVREDP